MIADRTKKVSHKPTPASWMFVSARAYFGNRDGPTLVDITRRWSKARWVSYLQLAMAVARRFPSNVLALLQLGVPFGEMRNQLGLALTL